MSPPYSPEAGDSRILDVIRRDAFGYFLKETNPVNGLVLDKTCEDWPASIAAVGLGLTAYPVGVERGLMTRAEAAERTLTTLRFFRQSRQGTEPDATGYKGFYYHFLDMQTGARAMQCELSTVDSALLIAGMLAAAVYFNGGGPAEREIRELAHELYARVDWRWAQDGGATVTHGWKPEGGFLRYRWEGYDEALVLYVLGLGSPTHPLSGASYQAWASTYEWRTLYDISYLHSGPLFTHQLSHIWLDLRGIQDAFMRAQGIDYFENSRRATMVQQRHAIVNPGGFAEYGALCWGVTASDGPGEITRVINGVERRFFGYRERGVPDGPDDGSIAPWAVVASLPFAPEIVLPTVADFQRHEGCSVHPYGFKATFNPTLPDPGGSSTGWVSPWHFGIHSGPSVAMVENYESGLIWRLMRGCPYVTAGLRAAGFTGGWLEAGS